MADPTNSGPPPVPPGVRTTRRRGRTSAAKVAALVHLGPRWSLPAEGPWTHEALVEAFGTDGPLLVDIGVGDGAASRAWAHQRPEARVLALEMHRPGIARLLTDLEAIGPTNVRVAEADAVAVLDAMEPSSVAAVRVLFPDPWPKRRHVARRIVDRAFVDRVAQVLTPGGELHLATDWADYADHMRAMVATQPHLRPLGAGHVLARPTTAYERRGIDAGRPIVDLVYRLTPGR